MKKIGHAAISLVSLGALALVGCGGSTPNTPSSTGAQSSASSAPKSASGSSATSGSKYGGTLSIEIPNNPNGLAPATVLQNEAGYVMATIYDGLTAYKPGTTQVVPGLAKSWKITNGGKTYTFTLRQGVTFQDGTPFNAQAVKFWLNRETNAKSPYYYAKRKGISTFVPFTFGNVTGFKVLGPYKISISLKQPNGEFLADLAMVWDGIPSPTAVKKWGLKYYEHPVGTGPFSFVKWVKGQYIEVKANPHYWNGKPYLDQILFKIIPSASVQLLALKKGTVDILTDVRPNDLSTIQSDHNLKLIKQSGLAINGISLPTQTGPFKKKAVRQALNYAVNKVSMDKSLYFGLAQRMNSPLPKVAFGYDSNIQPYAYNLTKAKNLLTQAGYPNGFSATLLTYTGPRAYNAIGGGTLATAIQQDLAKIGVHITINKVDSTTWLSTARSKTFHEMTLVGWTGDNGDPDDMISPLFNGNAFLTGNFAHYDNANVNQLFASALHTTNQAQRKTDYTKIQKQIMSDAPWIFLNYADLVRGVNTKVHGFVPNPTQFYFNMNKVWLSK